MHGCCHVCIIVLLECDHDDVLLPVDEEMLAENVGRDTRLRCNGGDSQDDPLLILEEELLLADNERSSNRTSPAFKEGGSLNVQLQSLMYHYIAIPVVEARLFIIGELTMPVVFCCFILLALNLSKNKLRLICSTFIGTVSQVQFMLYSFAPHLIVISYLSYTFL